MIKEIEVWKTIKDYPDYMVSNTGKVKSLDRYLKQPKSGFRKKEGRILSPMINKKGYPYVHLSKDGKSVSKRIHRLVAEAFIPNPDNLPIVNHKDEDKTNNHVSNLEWCTNKYNSNYGNRCQNISKTIRLWWEKRRYHEG